MLFINKIYQYFCLLFYRLLQPFSVWQFASEGTSFDPAKISVTLEPLCRFIFIVAQILFVLSIQKYKSKKMKKSRARKRPVTKLANQNREEVTHLWRCSGRGNFSITERTPFFRWKKIFMRFGNYVLIGEIGIFLRQKKFSKYFQSRLIIWAAHNGGTNRKRPRIVWPNNERFCYFANIFYFLIELSEQIVMERLESEILQLEEKRLLAELI